MAIRHRRQFPVGSSPDSIQWDEWNDDHVGGSGDYNPPIPQSDVTGLPAALADVPSADEKAALDGANAPNAGNPFVTQADIANAGAITSPLDLSGCQLWLDASQISGHADGDRLALWSDLSGNGYDAAQATANNKPTYKTNIQNGLAVVRFDPTSFPQYLALSGDGLDLFRNVGAWTIAFVIANMDIANDLNYFFQASDGIDVSNARIDFEVSTALDLAAANADGESATIRFPQGSIASDGAIMPPLTGLVSLDLLTGAMSLECAPLAVTSGPIFTATYGATPDTPSAAIFVGAPLDQVNQPGSVQGDICEIIVYNRALNARDRRLLLEYLSEKWGTL